MSTDFLASWQGVIIAGLIIIFLIFLVCILLKNLESLKGLRVSKDGVSFSNKVNLGEAIPRIDKQLNLHLMAFIASLHDVFRASITVDESSCGYADTCSNKGCTNPVNQKMLKMLLVKMMIIPLMNSVDRNHLVKNLSKLGLQKWLDTILAEISAHYKVIEDYCGFDLPDEAILTQARDAIMMHFVPRAQVFVKEAVQNKLSVYQRLGKDDKQKEKLEAKCIQYLENLE